MSQGNKKGYNKPRYNRETTRPNDFDVQSIIDRLQGTCMTLAEALPEGMDEMDLLPSDHDEIDNQIFKCETCDWWFETVEQAEDDENNCEGCSNE